MAKQSAEVSHTDYQVLKQKYLHQLALLEEKEADWRAQSELLKAGLLKLGMVAEGQHEQLDHYLQQLSKRLKVNLAADHLKEAIKGIELSSDDLVTHKRKRTEATKQSLMSIIDWYEGQSFPDGAKAQIQTLKKEVSKRFSLEKVDRYVAALANALDGAAIEIQEAPKRSVKKGFLSRLFVKSDATLSEEMVAKPESDLDCVKTLFETLVDAIEFPDTCMAFKDEFVSKLHKLSSSDINPIADAFSQLFTRSIETQQKEFERFLARLAKQLLEMGSFVQADSQSNDEMHSHQKRLDAVVRQQVSGMQDSVEKSEDISDLKVKLQDQLSHVLVKMDEFKRYEGERYKAAEVRIERLQSQLSSLESDSENLHQQIKTEKSRALRDALTGIANRYAYEERVEAEVARWQRYQTPLSLAIIDIDHFKLLNDGFGHQSGDKVLKVVATRLKNQLRATDFIARFGGEEFIVLMPQTDLERGRSVAEKLRKSIETCPFHFRGEDVKVTISIGLSEFNGDAASEEVFEKADKALYKAKNQGRNQVYVAES